ncbi:MAG: hypothetical protein ACJAWV_003099 [Flammeovirgaceae bacterium]|jgi:hypothetical protein
MEVKNKNWQEFLLNNRNIKLFLAVFGIVAGSIGIYSFFFKENFTNLQYVITSNSNVLDINADVSKIEILYDSTSLKRSKKNLKVINVRVINNGNLGILNSFYDTNNLLGLKIEKGEIVENPTVIASSSPYLMENVKTKLNKKKNLVTFNQVIIDSKADFLIKILILHDIDEVPHLVPIGKIAGQRKIEIVDSSEIEEEPSFLHRSFYGSVWIQLVRLIAYTFLGIVIAIFSAFIGMELSSSQKNRTRKKIINTFKDETSYRHISTNDVVFDRFIKDGATQIQKLSSLIDNEESLKELHKIKLATKNKKERFADSIINPSLTTFSQLFKDGFFIRNENSFIVNESMKQCLLNFNSFLYTIGELDIEK